MLIKYLEILKIILGGNMFKDLGLYELNIKNVKKYGYEGEPFLSKNCGDYLRKTLGFFPAPDKFRGYDNDKLLQKMKFESFKKGNVDFIGVQIKSIDGSILDTIEIVPRKKVSKPVYVVNIFGAVDAYEQNMGYMKEQSERLGVVNVGFNVPGVGRSTGTLDSKHTIIKAGVAQVIRLVEQGVEPEKIVMSGHSAGAAIAVACAEHLHKKGLKVNVFHNRSFGKTSTVAAALLLETPENHIKVEKSIKRFSSFKDIPAEVLTTSVANIAGWEIDVNKAYSSIPSKYKDYIVIKPDKIQRKYMTGDEMVRPAASLHYMQKDERKKIKNNIIKAINLIDNKGNVEELSCFIKSLSVNLGGSMEDKVILKRLLKNTELMKRYHKDIIGTQSKPPYYSEMRKDLKILYNQIKYERKFVVNIEALLKDIENPDKVIKRYNERCDRFLIKRDGDISENLKEIHKYEPYYADWIKLGMINEDKLKGVAKKEAVIELGNKMDVHAIPLEYIVQRKEKLMGRSSGLEYFDNFLKERNNNVFKEYA
jgi:alpha/beta superfamily hydrolase